ncbi:GNAT family N-acetyltransferase [Nocardia tengchongensis]|uniref:GNAT family N-acetyltransferase n=1 Tax=Nocardia tengchongensis TaxID=2055889 RepID=UPI003686A32D
MKLARFVATAPGRSLRIRDASPGDVSGIAHVMTEASASAYAHLPESAVWLPRVLASMALRMPAVYEERLGEIGHRRAAHRVLVAETSDNRIAGLIDIGVRDDGAGQLYAWHVPPEFHGRAIAEIGPTVGNALMAAALDHLGAVDVYSNTTVGTVGLRAHQKQGFEIDDSVPADDPRLSIPARWVEAGCPSTIVLPDGTVADVGRQVILIRRCPSGIGSSGA